MRNAGFDEIRFSDERYDTFSDAPKPSSGAARYGTQGVNFWAMKPVGVQRTALPDRATDAGRPISDSGSGEEILPEPDAVYDAGSLGCGDGPLPAIAAALGDMQPGAVLEILSTDPGVAADLPAWCRMVGHEFLGGGLGKYAGQYRVRRKQD